MQNSIPGIITAWQGPHGFDIRIEERSEDDPEYGRLNRINFMMRDGFKVEVFKAVENAGVWTMQPVEASMLAGIDLDKVDLVKIVHSPSGPTHGKHHEPPWTDGGGG
jgi:hypothetical protein